MQRDRGSWKLASDDEDVEKVNPGDFTCDECGTAFQKPLFATVRSSGETETYYACPRCMTKVENAKEEKPEIRENNVIARSSRKPSATFENNMKCEHFLGYLKQRPKNTPIPEDCLTCDKMVECLAH